MISNPQTHRRRGPAATAAGRPLLALLALLAAAALSASCDKAPLYAPTGTTITLTANTQVLPINGTAQITATVLESGGYAVQNGTMVTFTTSLGSFSASEVGTTNGRATVTFNAGTRAGTAVINAFSGANSTSGSTSSNNGTTTSTGTGVSILIGSIPTVTVTAPTVAPTAGVTATFTVTVAAGSGSSLIESVVVDFGDGTSVDLGNATGTLSVQHVYTKPGTYTVAATATDSSGQRASMSVPVIVFSAVPFTLTVTAPSGKSGVAITLTATPGAGAPAIIDYTWQFGDGYSTTTDVGTVPHIYTLPAGTTVPQQFVVTVRARGADGRVGVGSTFVTITP